MIVRFFLCTTLLLLCHPRGDAQTLTKQFPRIESASPQGGAAAIPDEPGLTSSLPEARVVPPPPTGVPVAIRSQTQGKRGDVYTLSGEVAIDYRDYTVRADNLTYNERTSEVDAQGHVQVDGGPDDEHIAADHGTLNLDAETGHFYGVVGTLGVRRAGNNRMVYTTPDPFVFTGKELIKDAPRRYRVIGGSMTSCRLPKPDWRLLSQEIVVDEKRAHARNSYFTLLRVPLFYLPYVTHAVDTSERESGILLPVGGNSSTKGYIIGEQVFWALNRSTDLTVGAEYFSKRGWSPSAQFRYKGRGDNFFLARFHSLLDRGLAPNNVNQGGADVLADGRRDLTQYTRAVADIEYLSSYIYRQAFEESFTLATSSQVKSQAFLTRARNGTAASVRFDRYQSFLSNASGNEIRILHLPSLEYEATDHEAGNSGLMWGFQGSLGGLTRAEPSSLNATDTTRLSSARVDLYPHLTMPLHYAGWSARPEFGIRETFYTRSQSGTSLAPVQRSATQNRMDFEAGAEIRPPALERDFSAPWLEKLAGGQVRHVLEPAVRYRYVTGIDDFNSTLRFDDVDVASDTNEILYSLTQRLFVKSDKTHPCRDEEAEAPDGQCGAGTSQWLSWQVAQKYFFDPEFGGAVTRGTRNVLATTLDLSGVAFLTDRRHNSPVISRLRLRTSSRTDLEWDVDYDLKAGRMTSNNLYATYSKGQYSLGAGYAHLNAPEALSAGARAAVLAPSTSTNYNQLRLTGTYGSPVKEGFSAGVNTGYDLTLNQLQYGGIQTTYNWRCCGMSVEFRRYALGSVRNDNQYLYSFTLAGIGTAGSLRRAERILGGALMGQALNPAAEPDPDCPECDNQ